MALIKSISGIRGTIGGIAGEGLTPPDIVKYASAYGTWLKQQHKEPLSVVIGRDARISGEMVHQLVQSTLSALGIDCIDIGLSTTPTVEVAVTELKAQGGIIITASHNPKQWNALKLLNDKGEFVSEADGAKILAIAEEGSFSYADVNRLGKISHRDDLLKLHINKILKLPYVDVKAIKAKKFTVVLDAINSSGGIAVPMLLEAFGCYRNYKNTLRTRRAVCA